MVHVCFDSIIDLWVHNTVGFLETRVSKCTARIQISCFFLSKNINEFIIPLKPLKNALSLKVTVMTQISYKKQNQVFLPNLGILLWTVTLARILQNRKKVPERPSISQKMKMQPQRTRFEWYALRFLSMLFCLSIFLSLISCLRICWISSSRTQRSESTSRSDGKQDILVLVELLLSSLSNSCSFRSAEQFSPDSISTEVWRRWRHTSQAKGKNRDYKRVKHHHHDHWESL